jgi:hypothetical protein
VASANGFLVPLKERAAENRGPNGDIVLRSGTLGFPNYGPVVNDPDLDFDVLESVSFNFDLAKR